MVDFSAITGHASRALVNLADRYGVTGDALPGFQGVFASGLGAPDPFSFASGLFGGNLRNGFSASAIQGDNNAALNYGASLRTLQQGGVVQASKFAAANQNLQAVTDQQRQQVRQANGASTLAFDPENPQGNAGVLRWSNEINSASREFGVPADVIAAVMEMESGGNQIDPHTGAGTYTSPAGALGLMQLMPKTAAGLQVDPHDPQQNIRGGAKYLSQLFQTYGDWNKALVAYNAGHYDPSASYNGFTAGQYAQQVGNIRSKYQTASNPVAGLASQMTGTPYVWGSAGGRSDFSDHPASFDCSGLTQWAYHKAFGVNIGATTYDQWRNSYGVSLADAQPGDLVFTPSQDHVGVYLGNGQMVHAIDEQRGVQVTGIYGGVFRRPFMNGQ